MKDFNFFEPYLEPGNTISQNRNKFIIGIIAILLALIIVAIPAFFQIRIIMARNNIEQNEQFLSKTESKEKIEDLNDKEDLLSSMSQQNNRIDKVDSELRDKDVIGTYLITSINESLPQDVFMNRLSLEREGIVIDGASEEKEDIAYFENNIRKANYFEDIFIPKIDGEEDYYTFTLDMLLRGEEEIEDGQDTE